MKNTRVPSPVSPALTTRSVSAAVEGPSAGSAVMPVVSRYQWSPSANSVAVAAVPVGQAPLSSRS